MTKPSNEQIAALYKQHSTEQPDQALDNAILDYARGQNTHTENKFRKSKPLWALAASIAAVLILLPLPQLFDQEHHIEQDSSELKPLRKGTPAPEQMKSKRLDITTETMPSPKGKPVATEPALSRKPQIQLEEYSETLSSDITSSDLPNQEFAKIQRLLANNKYKEAKLALKMLLSEQPELQHQLPNELANMLDEIRAEHTIRKDQP